MNDLLKKWTEALRRVLKLPDIERELSCLRSQMAEHIEQELSCLRSQMAEQEVRISATQALVVDQQYLLLEKLDLLQKDLDQVVVFKERDSSRRIDTACWQETSAG